ncbi:hypothetical protein [Plesiomonas shigelloides]|uniref:hypothetical protein n=1 Tax=Plesiomonas shigelloides TaxID=703 RepID=UPI001261EF7F|nr:hypothetical protein [Plesiomonas shigelloides]KAB7690885.1 hypothetical protein GBN20_04945 [Plesiomonas shigelloides]
MTSEELINAIKYLVTAFGGMTVVCVALITWLGQLSQKRILQNEQHNLSTRLKKIEHELAIEKSTYEHYLELIMNYYSTYYEHYRLCQFACEVELIKNPDGSISNTKRTFNSKLDTFINKWSEQEGKVRLLLPSDILEIHSESIQAFNDVRDAVSKSNNSDDTINNKIEAFKRLHSVKEKMEIALRKFLRTENLLK